jgi:hypothetical protein
MLWRVLLAFAVVFIVGLAVLFASTIVLPALGIPIAVNAGKFFAQWAWPIGVVFGIIQFATGRFLHPPA